MYASGAQIVHNSIHTEKKSKNVYLIDVHDHQKRRDIIDTLLFASEKKRRKNSFTQFTCFD